MTGYWHIILYQIGLNVQLCSFQPSLILNSSSSERGAFICSLFKQRLKWTWLGTFPIFWLTGVFNQDRIQRTQILNGLHLSAGLIEKIMFEEPRIADGRAEKMRKKHGDRTEQWRNFPGTLLSPPPKCQRLSFHLFVYLTPQITPPMPPHPTQASCFILEFKAKLS